MIIELEEGVWLADGEGDPPRTLVMENAKDFANMKEATEALAKARKSRPFIGARIIDFA